LDVTVVAPCWDSSGAAASLTAVSENGRVVVERGHLASGLTALGVHGPPSFIVRAAVYEAFGPPPDVILSGINRGPNVGRAILHSGTVGAALTAATFGLPAIAISAAIGDPPQWDGAAAVASRAVQWILRAPPGTVLNVNVPEHPADDHVEVVPTVLAPTGVVQANVTDRQHGFVPVTFGDGIDDAPTGTDAAALSKGAVSVTAIRPLCEDRDLDLAPILGQAG
jgi:5'-nucleotidase